MKRRVNISCGLCERPVTGVHYLWDSLSHSETTIWFHGEGDEEADQCFEYKSFVALYGSVLPGKPDNTDQ